MSRNPSIARARARLLSSIAALAFTRTADRRRRAERRDHLRQLGLRRGHHAARDRAGHQGFRGQRIPDIKIKSEAISFTEIARQLVLRVRAGNPPDVSQLAGNDTFLVAATGKLEPLDAYVGADLKAALKPDALRQLRVTQPADRAFPGRRRLPASGTTRR